MRYLGFRVTTGMIEKFGAIFIIVGLSQWRYTEDGGPWPKYILISHTLALSMAKEAHGPMVYRIVGSLRGLWPNRRYGPGLSKTGDVFYLLMNLCPT